MSVVDKDARTTEKEPEAGKKEAGPTPEDAAAAAKAAAEAKGTEAEPKTVEVPEEELLAMQRDQEELTRRRAEAARERGRTRKAREERDEAKRAAAPEGEPPAITADTIADAIVKAMNRTVTTARQPSIPGLKFEADGEVTYQGRSIDPDVAQILLDSRSENASLRETLDKVVQQQDEINARLQGEDDSRLAAETRAIEERHIARMEDYGVALFDNTFAGYEGDEAVIEAVREGFYASMGGVLNGLEDRGVQPEQITYEVVTKIAAPLIEKLRPVMDKVADRVQADVNAEARKTEPLKRGGTVAEPAPTDVPKTPEEYEAWLNKLAGDLAKEHKVGSGKPGVAERLNY